MDVLIQKTFNRLTRLIPEENIFILTNARYNDLVLEQLPNLTTRQVILEPAMRNTAPCILYASLKIQKENEELHVLNISELWNGFATFWNAPWTPWLDIMIENRDGLFEKNQYVAYKPILYRFEIVLDPLEL